VKDAIRRVESGDVGLRDAGCPPVTRKAGECEAVSIRRRCGVRCFPLNGQPDGEGNAGLYDKLAGPERAESCLASGSIKKRHGAACWI